MTPVPTCALVGWVGGEPVTREMLAIYLEDHPPPAALGDNHATRTRWAARAVMSTMLAGQEARRRGFAGESDLRAAVATELVGKGEPEAVDVRAYFDRNRHRYDQPERRRVSHVLCVGEDDAVIVAGRARAGEAIGALAEEFSTDPGSRRAGGDLGWLRRGELAGAVEDSVFSAEAGQVVGPVRSPFGWHVLVVAAIEPARAEDFASVREEIAAELAERRRREAYLDWFEKQALAGITMAPGYEHPFRPNFLEWAHRH
ncbi:MAG TPA: peptidyl-prolyl cis-trans isomerase [Acidimicrobiales bacterium]|nr:peptidyl-prolyl cis-trans isomerase [Acidimicrobiales bacterium]